MTLNDLLLYAHYLDFEEALYLGYDSVEKKRPPFINLKVKFSGGLATAKRRKCMYSNFLEKPHRVMSTVPNDVCVSGNTVGRKKAAAEEKSSNDLVTFDTVFQMGNGYSTRNLTKCACFDVNWYRQ